MLKYKLKSITTNEIVWDVKYWFKFNPTVKDFLEEIKKRHIGSQGSFYYDQTVWVYGGGINLGYAFFQGDNATYYFNGNIGIQDAIVVKCECRLRGTQYLFRIWTKVNYESAISPVRPIVPQRFLKTQNL